MDIAKVKKAKPNPLVGKETIETRGLRNKKSKNNPKTINRVAFNLSLPYSKEPIKYWDNSKPKTVNISVLIIFFIYKLYLKSPLSMNCGTVWSFYKLVVAFVT